MPTPIPTIRLRRLNDHPENAEGDYVLYWMIAARRTRYNFALQHAANRAQELGVGLVVLEPLRVDYQWASDRLHHFILDGMRDNQREMAKVKARYYPYVEPKQGAGKGLLVALAKRAVLVVSDDTPIFFLPKMLSKAATDLSIRLEVVDGNGIYPIRATERIFTTAASFRRHLQKELPEHLADVPQQTPLARRKLKAPPPLPTALVRRWPEAKLADADTLVSKLDIDHAVGRTRFRGGMVAARQKLKHFLEAPFDDYLELRNEPEAECQSYLSPYLHFGHISAHEVFLSVMKREDWSPAQLADRANGSRHGWWGASETAEAFLDQLITWRELGHNMAALHPRYREFDSLPAWAQTTLRKHADDARAYQYSLRDFESAATHDPLWNAAQRQLLAEGIMHNYLRMLWGKKILEWTPTPKTALRTMIELNNKYALDGRDPNSYSGIFWTLGRYDRAWGPERPIFGKVRYMSSDSAARKLKVREYLRRYGER